MNSRPLMAYLSVLFSWLMLCHSNSFGQSTGTPEATSAQTDPQLEDIVVTATRREESLSRVPISIAAYSQQKMDDQGIRSIEDIARLTPDVQFNSTTGVTSGQSNSIAIRGITSAVGASTTGVYIDDTPIQIRTLLNASGTSYPEVFDLERVEVLRGPQGTLFGAGSEGGAVRFITPQPNLSSYSGNARVDISATQYGAPSYEAGVAFGGPIIQDTLGFRVSAWSRLDGGYINQVSPFTDQTVDRDTNYQISQGYKAALTWKPSERLTVTPSLFYQNLYFHDRGEYWENISDPAAGKFEEGALLHQPSSDSQFLPALRIQYHFDAFEVINNVSFFKRDYQSTLDYTTFNAAVNEGNPFNYTAADAAPSYNRVQQDNYTEELRVQSNAQDALIDWSVGVFADWNKELARQATEFPNLGLPLYQGLYSFTSNVEGDDRQVAGFADVSIHATDKLKINLGGRYSDTKFSYTNNGNGPFNGGAVSGSGAQKESPVTPKYGLSYQVTPQDFVYFSAAEGFRIGGVNGPVVNTCGTDLAQLGLTAAPATYKSDRLWSYEIGAKDTILDGRVKLDSSIYRINWSNIQQRIYLRDCGSSFVGNLGATKTTGGDINADIKIIDALLLDVAVGYYNETYDNTSVGGGGAILAANGAHVVGGNPLVATISPVYRFTVRKDRDAFVRADYTYRSAGYAVDSRVYGYDPSIPGQPSTRYLSLRVGMTVSDWEISAYANNVTNESAGLFRNHDDAASPLFYNTTYRPLTIGATITTHF